MIDWQERVSRPQLICAATNTPIEPGQIFHSGLKFVEGSLQRLDYSEAAWKECDQSHFISWWRLRRPEAEQEQGPKLLGPEALLDIFHKLKDANERPKQFFAWLLAWLLVRAKKLRYLDLENTDAGSWLIVQEKGGKSVLRLRDPDMTDTETELVQGELEQLFTLPGSEIVEDDDAATPSPAADEAGSHTEAETDSETISEAEPPSDSQTDSEA